MEKEKNVVLNVRLTERQARWLRARAKARHDGNISAAARQALTEAWVFARCREEYQALREVGVRLPRWPDSDETTFLEHSMVFGFEGAVWQDEDVEAL